MMRLTAFAAALLLLAGALLPGCSKDEVLDIYGDLVAIAGNVGLTSSLALEGDRKFGQDKYTGTYEADYEAFTGQECPFGGTMLEKRAEEQVTVSWAIRGRGGVRLVWNCGAEQPVTLADGPGESEQTVYLAPGSNYFDLTFEDFTGSVELKIE